MPDLDFKITSVHAAERGLNPLLNFTVEVTNAPATEVIHTVMLQAQIQIQAPQRGYAPTEKEKLTEIFGPPEQWSQTLRAKLWAHSNTVVRSFSETTSAIFSIPCSFDLNVLATKYFYGLENGEIPLLFLFSGTVFYESDEGRLQVQQIPWSKESAFRLPVRVWHELMQHHYPNVAWITFHRDVFDHLHAYRRSHHLATWDETIESLLLAVDSAETLP